jgi:hypothetical protein
LRPGSHAVPVGWVKPARSWLIAQAGAALPAQARSCFSGWVCFCSCSCLSQLQLLFKSPLIAPWRRARKRIRCGDCLSEAQRSEFRRAPLPSPATRGLPKGAQSSGSPFLGYFFWRSKRSNPAAGPGPGLVDWKDERNRFTSQYPLPRRAFHEVPGRSMEKLAHAYDRCQMMRLHLHYRTT